MGNRVSTVSDVLTIKIGGDPNDKKAKKNTNNRIKSTKYTLLTFLPQNLLEQFRRIANFYFLIMVVIAVVIDSPVSPLTSLIPLVFVIAVTAAKQGYEDFLRHKADNMVNFSFVTVIRNGSEVDIKCQDIIQGDLVKAARDCDVPCDLVLLKSCDSHGKCHITTANLDGETNLKTLSVPKGLPSVSLDKLHTLGVIECEQPRTDLYTFTGRIELSSMHRKEMRHSNVLEIASETSHVLPLMADNLLLRGSRVKNTEWAIGCAVYTGQNTKLSLNSRLTRNKMSSSEKFVNKYLIFFLFLLISIVTISYFLKRYYDMYHMGHNQYMGEIVSTYQVSQFLQDYFSFLILFNYLIPISLYVTIEMHKFLGSFFMEWDTELYDVDTNQPFIVNTSDLNEELGQVKILFSDKTGTLTKNEMILQQVSIKGKMYTLSGSGIQQSGRINVMKIHEFQDDVFNFFQTLSTCHTVQVAGHEEDVIPMVVSSSDTTTTATPQSSSPVNEEDDPEQLQKVTTFNNISEENENHNTPESDLDEMDFISKLERLIPSSDHIAPPAEYDNVNFAPKFDRFHSPDDALDTRIIARSSNNSRANTLESNGSISRSNKIHPKRPISINDFQLATKPLGSLSIERTKLQRPLSTDFQRTISAVDVERLNHMTHRRTQSYGASTTHNRLQDTNGARRPSKIVSFLRNSESVTNMREYYAAPSFNEASRIERMDSVRRKNEIKSVVDRLDYQASSPDEKAMVEGCAKIGFLFTGEVNDELTVKLQPFKGAYMRKTVSDTVIKFERLSTLEFTSDRKRMSTIVRDRKGQIWLLTKGAESHVLPLCQTTSRTLVATTQSHINDYARVGLRTLAVARRKMSEEEYANYENDITVAGNSMTNRKALIDEVQTKLENNLDLLGATAVEDALQDNVRDTLESLRYAGIKVWVLTGDKVETALNIALACGHIPDNAEKYFITECTEEEQLRQHFDILEKELDKNPDALFSLLIDGSSLAVALKQFDTRFRDLAIRCRAVLCCRLSPLQKCEVVHLIKTSPGKPITAAIGDGANDVSMIQEAHVGLGIVGKEGRQAARCADYAFANFAMLKRVLLVHGYYYTQRLALLVLYFFYKNLVFMMIQLFFQIDSMFSSQTVYDSLFLTLYNVIYTSLPVLFISLTEKVYTEEKLLKNPPLYKENEGNKRFSWKYFVGWMTLAVYHASAIYVTGWLVWTNNAAILPRPYTVNFFCFGTFMIHNVVVLVNLKLWLEARYQSYWFIVTVLGSIMAFVVTTVIYNLFDLDFDGDMLWVYNTLLGSPTFWLLFVFIMVAALLPDYVLKVCKAFNISFGSIYPGNDQFRAKKLFNNHGRTETTYL